jgi:single-strand DNA-binding protein
MGLNVVTLEGRVPFDLELKGNEGKEYMGFSISVQRDYKPEGDQYYPEDLIYCKAFSAKAKFISQYFEKGSGITLVGEVRRDDDYEKDGQTIKGQIYILVNNVYFPAGGSGKKSDGEQKAPVAAPSKKVPGANPLTTKNKKKIPF